MALHQSQVQIEPDNVDSGYITLRDYLYYNDILYYGSYVEKITQSYRMLDLTNGKAGFVT